MEKISDTEDHLIDLKEHRIEYSEFIKIKNRFKKNRLVIVFALLIMLLLVYILPFSPSENKGLALLVFVAILWLTEAVHMTVTALSIPLVAILMGLMDTKEAFAQFSNPTIFLFLGGFCLAGAFRVQQIDQILVNKIIRLSKGNFLFALIGLFFITILISGWISNTATAAMMLPLLLGIITKIPDMNNNTKMFVLLGLAYTTSMSGLTTLLGSPPNAIVGANLGISFSEWFQYGLVSFILLYPVMIGALYLLFRPKLNYRFTVEDKKDIPKMNFTRWMTLFIFCFIALSWTFSSKINPFISNLLGLASPITSFDSVVAILAIVLFAGSQLGKWLDIMKSVDWSILLLFGGGLALSVILDGSGASVILTQLLSSVIKGNSLFAICIIVALFCVYITEFTSNTASAALFIPIFISVSGGLGVNPILLSMIIGVTISCAFMLPISTPPNAIVYATGMVPQKAMIKAGVILDALMAVLVAVIGYYLWQ